jgi:hypothetical protein
LLLLLLVELFGILRAVFLSFALVFLLFFAILGILVAHV